MDDLGIEEIQEGCGAAVCVADAPALTAEAEAEAEAEADVDVGAGADVDRGADGGADGGAAGEDRLDRLERVLAAGVAELKEAFESRLAWDRHKDEQIDRLHAELVEHRQDLLARATRPLVLGIIRLHDDLGRMVEALRRRPAEELTSERFFTALDGFGEDIELLLGTHGIEVFELSDEVFDPKHQTALGTVAADDPAQVGRIARRLRPGFTAGEQVLQKERVTVFASQLSQSTEEA